MNELKNRIEAINKVHTLINECIPELRVELQQGFKQKVDGSLFAKYKDRLDDVLIRNGAYLDNSVRVGIRADQYRIMLWVDARYQVGEFSCCYYEQTSLIYSITTPSVLPDHIRPILNLGTVKKAQVEADTLLVTIEKLVQQHQQIVSDNKLLNRSIFLDRR